jgi:hypothetical protein
MDSSSRQKINRENLEVSNSINRQVQIILENTEYTSFSTPPGTFSKIHYNIGYRRKLK